MVAKAYQQTELDSIAQLMGHLSRVPGCYWLRGAVEVVDDDLGASNEPRGVGWLAYNEELDVWEFHPVEAEK